MIKYISRNNNKKIIQYIFGILLFILLSSCGKNIAKVNIPLAISQTQTVSVKNTLDVIYQTATQPTPQSLALIYGQTQEYSKSGISFSYDTAIFQDIKNDIYPSKEKWVTFHLQRKQKELVQMGEGVPDYFFIQFKQSANLPTEGLNAYLVVRPIKNTEGQYYPVLLEDKGLSEELEKMVKRLEDQTLSDRFFDQSQPRMESHRSYLSFKNGTGVRYLTGISKQSYPFQINQDNFAYVFEGLTSDGRYYVEAMIGVSFPNLTDNLISPAQYQQDITTYANYITNIDWQLRMVTDQQFTPNLDKLDQWINSLNVVPEISVSSAAGGETQIRKDDLGLGKPTFEDTFEKAPSYIFLGKDAYTQTEAKDGSLVFTSMVSTADRWRAMELYPLGDAYFEILARHGDVCSGKDGFGLIIRSVPLGSNYNSGYIFAISCDGMYRVYKLDENGRYFEVINWTANQNILAGANRVNRVGVLAKGNSFSLYVNSSMVFQFEDDLFPSGTYGIMISSPETENYRFYIDEFAFWNLFAKAIAVPTATSVMDVQYVPLVLNECEQIQLEINKSLKLSSNRVEYPFFDPLDESVRGKSCHIELSGNGAQTNRGDLISALSIFTDFEWVSDALYDESGVQEERRAFRKAPDRVAIVNIQWKPAEGVTCPPDQSVAQCIKDLDPELIIYTLTIDGAQRTATVSP